MDSYSNSDDPPPIGVGTLVLAKEGPAADGGLAVGVEGFLGCSSGTLCMDSVETQSPPQSIQELSLLPHADEKDSQVVLSSKALRERERENCNNTLSV